MANEKNNYTGIKKYKLLIMLVVVLMIVGFGCWFVKKRNLSHDDVRNDGLLRQLNQKK